LQQKEVLIFNTAPELSSEAEGETYHDPACAGDNHLPEQVEALLGAHLFRLDGTLFLDFRITELEGDEQVIKPHRLVKVFQIQPTLKMVGINQGWLKRELVKKPGLLALAHDSWTPSLGGDERR
jgi:hypothetical protein